MAFIAAAAPEILAAAAEGVGAIGGAAEGVGAVAGAAEGVSAGGGSSFTGAAKNISSGQLFGKNPLESVGKMNPTNIAGDMINSAMQNQQNITNKTLSGLNESTDTSKSPGSDSSTEIM